MLTIDWLLCAALAVAIAAWWMTGLEARRRIVALASMVALVTGVVAVMDHRWQAAGGAAVAVLLLVSALAGKLREGRKPLRVPYASGSTTGGVCMVDPRCAAGVNLDGGDYDFQPFNRNIPVPFLMFYSDLDALAAVVSEDPDAVGHGFNDFSYERHETAGLRSDVYRLTVGGVTHLGVSDFSLFMRAPWRAPLFGGIDAGAIIGIQNDFVRGFFDRHLRGLENGFPEAEYARYSEDVRPYRNDGLREWWLAANPMLDTGYTADGRDGHGYATFGRVLRGMRVLERIQRLPSDAPTAIATVQGQILEEPVVIRRAYRAGVAEG